MLPLHPKFPTHNPKSPEQAYIPCITLSNPVSRDLHFSSTVYHPVEVDYDVSCGSSGALDTGTPDGESFSPYSNLVACRV